jgi:hypothetical protein
MYWRAGAAAGACACWYPAQVCASVAGRLSGDFETRDILRRAVERTARKGADGTGWVARHLRLADRHAAIAANPESAKSPGRAARAGDLVVLACTLDPRVRVVLEVVPSSASDKVTVFDETNKEGRRQFLTSHVTHVEWRHGEVGPSRVAGA